MNQILDKKYNYLSNFFKTAIDQKRLFHSIILYGSNNLIQYAMALELARQLNCLENKREDCNCQNCRWIRENKHPAILTISKIDNKSDSSKTVISEEQINTILDTLVNSSDYHRVFIFCDATMKTLSNNEIKEYEEFKLTGFKPPQNSDNETFWYPTGVNTNCFSTVAANAMLKSIEEPSENVHFIFLTNNKEDLLQTIISRSQVFYMADTQNIYYNTGFFKQYFTTYPTFNKNSALDFVNTLLNFQYDNNLETTYVLDCIQYFLIKLAENNFENTRLLEILQKDIEKIQKAKNMAKAYIKEQNIYEYLSFYFIKR